MNYKKRISLLGGLLAVCVWASGCGAREDVSADPKNTAEEIDAPISIDTDLAIEDGTRIAVVAKATTGEFWDNVKAGMEDAVDCLNKVYKLKGENKITMTFEGPDSAEELTDMINTVDAVLSENPTVLCLASGDEDAGQAQLETAKENGIPVILFDSKINTDEEYYVTYCGSNDRAMGKEAGKKMAEALDGNGKVALVTHWENDQTRIDRVEGFREALEENAPEIEEVQELVLEEDGDLEEELEDLLEAEPNLKGIYCTNTDTSEEVLEVLEGMEDDSVKVIGIDGSSKQIEAIREGREVGTVSQNPYLMGFQTIYTAVQVACDSQKEIEKNIYTDYMWLDAANLDNEENAPYIYK